MSGQAFHMMLKIFTLQAKESYEKDVFIINTSIFVDVVFNK